MAPFERAMVVSYRLLIALWQFAIECRQRSNQQGVDYFGAKFGEERVDRCKLTFNTIWEMMGMSYRI